MFVKYKQMLDKKNIYIELILPSFDSFVNYCNIKRMIGIEYKENKNVNIFILWFFYYEQA